MPAIHKARGNCTSDAIPPRSLFQVVAAYFFQKPCVILRPETEWVEIVETGAATLADADTDKILKASKRYLQQPPIDFPEIFGDGHAAEFMLERMLECY